MLLSFLVASVVVPAPCIPQTVLSCSGSSGVMEAGLLGAQGGGSCRSRFGCRELVLYGAQTVEESGCGWVGGWNGE